MIETLLFRLINNDGSDSMRSQAIEAQAEFQDLISQLKAAQEDSAMLDWLAENECGIVPFWKDDPNGVLIQAGWLVVAAEDSEKTYGIELVRPTIREGVSAAMAKEAV